ncbi:hypothetical protein CGZ80_14705 [Rhodopirellula sp. MGV]|nr:hypothetical protein CGZ80_14705 [Rhodopirellula sp. MGV]PNY36911.1 hypothetical protein C2E31_10665 [Rhodopirellula baltica]
MYVFTIQPEALFGQALSISGWIRGPLPSDGGTRFDPAKVDRAFGNIFSRADRIEVAVQKRELRFRIAL